MSDCIFCKIVTGEIPSEKIYEDGEFVAILDINPVNKGHTLVLPRDHTPDFAQAPERVLDGLLHVAQKISRAVVDGLKADGFNFSTNNGRAAHQTIDHLHFHIVPRFFDDGLKPWPQTKYEEGEMASVAEKIREQVNK